MQVLVLFGQCGLEGGSQRPVLHFVDESKSIALNVHTIINRHEGPAHNQQCVYTSSDLQSSRRHLIESIKIESHC